MFKKKIKKFNLIDTILSLIVGALLVSGGGYLASGNWLLPFFEALGSKVVGWILIVVGGLSLLSSIAQLVRIILRKI